MANELQVREKEKQKEEENRKQEKETKETEIMALKIEIEALKEEMEVAKKTQINQGDFSKAVVSKLIKTKSFLTWFQQLTKGMLKVGKNIIMEKLMKECPELKLKKKGLGWDPSYKPRANELVRKIIQQEVDFEFINHLQREENPLTVEEIQNLEVDYAGEFIEKEETVQENYAYPDDHLPYFMPADVAETAATTHNARDRSATETTTDVDQAS